MNLHEITWCTTVLYVALYQYDFTTVELITYDYATNLVQLMDLNFF